MVYKKPTIMVIDLYHNDVLLSSNQGLNQDDNIVGVGGGYFDD